MRQLIIFFSASALKLNMTRAPLRVDYGPDGRGFHRAVEQGGISQSDAGLNAAIIGIEDGTVAIGRAVMGKGQPVSDFTQRALPASLHGCMADRVNAFNSPVLHIWSAFLQGKSMFDWDDLRLFLSVARMGRIAPAARALGWTRQPFRGVFPGLLKPSMRNCSSRRGRIAFLHIEAWHCCGMPRASKALRLPPLRRSRVNGKA